jgi:hypothetical protein
MVVGGGLKESGTNEPKNAMEFKNCLLENIKKTLLHGI